VPCLASCLCSPGTVVAGLDAIHLATAARLGIDLVDIVTYDERMTVAAGSMGYRVAMPT
jgi:uncharacterized protein